MNECLALSVVRHLGPLDEPEVQLGLVLERTLRLPTAGPERASAGPQLRLTQISRILGTVLGSFISATAMPNRPPQLLVDFLRRQTLAWLVPLVVMAAITAGYSVYQVHRSQSAEVKATAGHVAEDISRAVERRHHGLLAIAAAVSSDGDPHDLKGWYKNGGAYDRIFDTPVVVADAQRRILMHTRRLPGEPFKIKCGRWCIPMLL